MAAPKKSPADRRTEIMAATLDLISEKGIGALRAADVAQRLGVSTGLIFYHFATLEDLVVRAFEFAAERDLSRINAAVTVDAGSVAGRLRTVLREYGPTGSAPGWRLWIEALSASLRTPALRELVATMDTRWRDTIADLIAEGDVTGEFRCPDPHGAAWRITSMLDGLAVQAVTFDGAVTPQQIDAWTDVALRAELHG